MSATRTRSSCTRNGRTRRRSPVTSPPRTWRRPGAPCRSSWRDRRRSVAMSWSAPRRCEARGVSAFIAAVMIMSGVARAGAPRDGDAFMNAAGPRGWPGPQVTLPFFARKAWTSLVGRDGGATLARRGTRFVAGLGMGDLVRNAGGQVVELDWGESVQMGVVRVHCVPAQHFSGRSIVGHNRRLWVGWVVEGSTHRFYHAGDTGYFDGFRALRERFGRIDVAALPIGAYEPAEMMRPVHLDPDEAVRAAVDLDAPDRVALACG